jgi:hypothetical protein
MADITPKNEVPSDHMEVGSSSNAAPPAAGQRVAPDSHEATAELTRAVNEREEDMEEDVDEKHGAKAARSKKADDDDKPKRAAAKKKDDDKQAKKQNACAYCGHKNDEDATACGGCGIVLRM